MSNDTKLSISLECDDLIDGLDKAAAKIARFSETAKSAIDAVDKKTKSMSETEQRAYDVLKRSYEKHSNAIKEMAKEYEALRSKRKSGADMTATEWAQLKNLTAQYKQHSGALATVSKELGGMEKAASKLNSFVDIKSAASSAAGGIAAIVASKGIEFLTEFADSVVTVGLKTQQTAAQFSAMTNSVSNGAVAYQAFNDVARNTNYDFEAVYEMGKQLLNMGYSAKNAADLIQLCSDTAAALGTGQNGAAELVKTISMIQTAGKMEEDQLAKLQMAGINVDVVFSKLGLTGVEAMQALRNGSLDGKDAVAALTDYMHKFDGAMAKSKDNITDMWGDVAGNVATACGEIGAGIANMVKESQMMQDLIDFTQSLVDLVRGEGSEAWKDIQAVAQFALDIIANGLQAVYTTIKLGIIWINELYGAFKTMCQKVYEHLRFILEPLGEVFRIVSGILKLAGKEIKSGVDVSYKETIKQTALPDEENHFVKGLDRSSTAKSSEATRVAQEEQKKYQAVLKETEKINKDIVKAEFEGVKVARQSFLIGKNRIDQLEAESKWIREDAERQKASETELFAERMKNLEKQIEYYKGNPGIPGAAETLEALETQKTKEMELHDQRLSNIAAESEARIENNEAVLASLGMEDNPGADLSADGVDGLSVGLDKFMQAQDYLNSLGVNLTQLDKLAANTLGKGFASAFEAIVNGSQSASEAFANMTKQLLLQCANLLAQWTAIFAMVSIWRGPSEGAKAANKMVLGLATGGYITGAGTGTSDSIPAMLSNGEYVINARAVRAVGLGTLDMINSGRLPAAKFANGGLVGDAVASSNAVSTSNHIVLNVSTLDASSFEDALRNGGLLQSIKQALFDSDRDFAGSAGVW